MSDRWAMWALERAEIHPNWGDLALPSTTPPEAVAALVVDGLATPTGFLTPLGAARRRTLRAIAGTR